MEPNNGLCKSDKGENTAVESSSGSAGILGSGVKAVGKLGEAGKDVCGNDESKIA
jgi:hypothetical protein